MDNFIPSRLIARVVEDTTLRKIFLDIVNNTQFRKCKQLRGPFIRRLEKCVKDGMSDAEIYDDMKQFIKLQPVEVRRKIQHQGHYRGINRSNKIENYVTQFGVIPLTRVLDLGCGDGSITRVLREQLKLRSEDVHGCDITQPQNTENFTFTLLDQNTPSVLPYLDNHFDVVYALMAFHHIRNLPNMLREIKRVLRPQGLLIIREHDCVDEGLAVVLDIVHGFYSMVWCEPAEHKCFQTEYFADYHTAQQMNNVISENTEFKLLLGTNRNEPYPLYYHGKVINPLKHYWAVYQK